MGLRFFRAFRAVVNRMARRTHPRAAAAARETLALIQLARGVSSVLIQDRGWLDGRPDFLRQSVDDTLASGRQLHRDLFRPLFGTLNQRPELRRRARRFGRMPFLNGGLFEPHPLERAWRGEVSDDCWREAFDGLFRAVPVHGARGRRRRSSIAPDMLGRVFEGLMEPEERRARGAFFTPAALVRQLVDAARCRRWSRNAWR